MSKSAGQAADTSTGNLENPRTIEIKFADGHVSKIDERMHQLLVGLEDKVKFEKQQFPFFWDLSSKIDDYDDIFLEFYSYLLKHRKVSKAQLFQDLFVQFIHGDKSNGTFLEFGATDGVSLSNSMMLENKFGWSGVLAEPSPQWHEKLFENRPNSTILTECIYSETGRKLDFFVSDSGVLSTLDEFRESDVSSMPGNTQLRNASGYNCEVETISLNDVILEYFDGAKIDYMSVDTEGSELLILKQFDFSKYAPKVVTVEHNFTDAEKELDQLFFRNNYKRFFKGFTQFDAWYVLQE